MNQCQITPHPTTLMIAIIVVIIIIITIMQRRVPLAVGMVAPARSVDDRRHSICGISIFDSEGLVQRGRGRPARDHIVA